MATRFARISMLAPFAAAATGFSCLYGKRSPSVCSAKPNDKSGNEIVAIYLTKQSREQLKRYLERSPLMKEILPIQDPSLSPSVITILRSKDRKDTFEYEPVFGERAAFRLKSIIATKEGRIAVSICHIWWYFEMMSAGIWTVFHHVGSVCRRNIWAIRCPGARKSSESNYKQELNRIYGLTHSAFAFETAKRLCG